MVVKWPACFPSPDDPSSSLAEVYNFPVKKNENKQNEARVGPSKKLERTDQKQKIIL